MLSCSISFVFFAIVLCASAAPYSGERISGGHTSDEGQFKFQAMIHRVGGGSNAPLCGGSIVSDRHVLTSATCAEALRLETTKIGVGNNFQNLYPVSRIKIHELFVDGHNDIAVIVIQGQFKNVSNIGLDYEYFDEEIEVTALGFTRRGVSDINQHLKVP